MKWWAPLLGWPLALFGYLLAPLYAITFGLLDRWDARQNERQLGVDVRFALKFLFTEHEARIIPNEGVPFPPAFGGAYVTIAVGQLLLQFIRGREEFGVHVSTTFAPSEWHDLSLVLCVVAGEPEIERRTFRDAWHVSRTLEPHIKRLLQLVSVEWFNDLKAQLERDVYKYERVASLQASSALNLWIYGDKR
jgi:hypothetical protein